jgi:hypothetical protein
MDASGNAPLDPGLFVDTRGWADESSDVRRMAQRNGATDGPIPQRTKKKDDTGNVGLEELLEGGDESTGHKRSKSPTGARPIANASMPSIKANQTSGRIAAMVEDPTAAPKAKKPKPKKATAQVAVVVVVLVLVLASAGMAIYYFKH